MSDYYQDESDPFAGYAGIEGISQAFQPQDGALSSVGQDSSSYAPIDLSQYLQAFDGQNNSSTPSAVPDHNQSLLNHLVPDSDIGSAPESPGVFTKILQGVGLAGKDGSIDYSNPRTMDQIFKMIGVGGNIIGTLMGPQNKKSPQELQAQFKSPFDSFNPTQQAAANQYFNSPYIPHGMQHASSMQSPIVAGRRYAQGGQVEPDDNNPTFHSSGALSLVHGPGGGQDDMVPARLGPGEYVMDADTVAALGDGSNEHGAKVLDQWREELRSHKRAAPPSKIPPKAKTPSAYLKGGK